MSIGVFHVLCNTNKCTNKEKGNQVDLINFVELYMDTFQMGVH